VQPPISRRPSRRERGVPPAGADLAAMASAARYTASAAHKGFGHRFKGTPSSLRTDATECPTDLSQRRVEKWLREAIIAGDVGGTWEPDTYPQLVWKRVGDIIFEGRVSNRDSGWYHGYPITTAEAPRWLE
jgi:hypothetical protein